MSSLRVLRAFSTRANTAKFAANATYPKTVLNTSVYFRSFAIPNLKRAYSTEQTEQKTGGGSSGGDSSGGSSGMLWLGAAGLLGAGVGYYFYSTNNGAILEKTQVPIKPKTIDYQKIYNQIADILEDNDWDDGSNGPVFVRLAWHAAGTYDKVSKTGGSNGATMRFSPESDHGANAGLKFARDKLEPIKQKNPEISYSDLWSLAGVTAIQEMGGPTIPWIPGRKDADAATACSPDGRLPDATKGPSHIRDIFYRMGFDDREIVALVGAHALGRCHPDRSGFDGPWTASPTMFTNNFFTELLGRKWVEKKWKGPKQYIDKETGELMMLPADMALMQDKNFRPWVEKYAKDEELFFKDFAAAFHKLLELGIPRTGEEKVYHFKKTDESS
ncbi:heme peroxidase [Rhizophagus irregularis]|uniref:Peroxidase n=1 Tax=Rhizophagus irregularis TaxID=588596 RepID=A0A2N0S8M7_9GLOM|nr:heme peroxidase [Rhizophagus irregularis]